MARRTKARQAQCSFCPKVFTRTEHLQRHLGSHGVGEEVICPDCGKGFMRKDVMKRHLAKCRLKGTAPGLGPGQQTTNAIQPDNSSSGTVFSASDSQLQIQSPPADPQAQALWSDVSFESIQFLLDSTYLDRTEETRLQLHHPAGFGIPCINIDPAETFNFLARIADRESTSLKTRYGCVAREDEGIPPNHGAANSDTEALNAIASQITSRIATICQTSQITAPWTPSLSRSCTSFFSPTNLSRFTHLYWTAWHPHYPVLHKPTFDIPSTPPFLIAAMSIIGACFSPLETDRINARVWLNPVEEIIFSHRYFGDVLLLDEATVSVREAVQLLQAAYCISTCQISEGSRVARRRIRRGRFGMVVSVARDLNLFHVAHRDLERVSEREFCWAGFVATEECIRTMLFIYIHDTGYTIFSNYPPRTRVQEMCLDVACPEACFQACSAKECFSAIRIWTGHAMGRSRMRLRDIVEGILGPASQSQIPGEVQSYLSHLGVLNLWIVCSALVSETLALNTLFSPDPNLSPLRSALETWKAAWNQRYILTDNFGLPKEEDAVLGQGSLWKRVGFFQNAAEYWLLVHILLKRMESSHGGGRARPYMPSRCDETGSGMVDLKALILEHQLDINTRN